MDMEIYAKPIEALKVFPELILKNLTFFHTTLHKFLMEIYNVIKDFHILFFLVGEWKYVL